MSKDWSFPPPLPLDLGDLWEDDLLEQLELALDKAKQDELYCKCNEDDKKVRKVTQALKEVFYICDNCKKEYV